MSQLGRVSPVVEPDGDDLARDDRGEQAQVVEPAVADDRDGRVERRPVEELDRLAGGAQCRAAPGDERPPESAVRRGGRRRHEPSRHSKRHAVGRPSGASGRLDALRAANFTPRPRRTMQHAVLDRVDERLPAGLDDVLGDADGAPLPRRRSSMSTRVTAPVPFASSRTRTLKSMSSIGELRMRAADREAQRAVEGVDGTVALGGADEPLVADLDLDRGLGRRPPSSRFSTITRKLSRRKNGSYGAISAAAAGRRTRRRLEV